MLCQLDCRLWLFAKTSLLNEEQNRRAFRRPAVFRPGLKAFVAAGSLAGKRIWPRAARPAVLGRTQGLKFLKLCPSGSGKPGLQKRARQERSTLGAQAGMAVK